MTGPFIGKPTFLVSLSRIHSFGTSRADNNIPVRTIEHSRSEASTARKLRKALNSVGPIDTRYVNSFEPLSQSMEEPILELRALGEFIESIVREGNGVACPRRRQAKLSPSRPLSALYDILRSAPKASDNSQALKTKSTATSRPLLPFLSAILNPEAATSEDEDMGNTENTATTHTEGLSALIDLLEAASHDSTSTKNPKPDRLGIKNLLEAAAHASTATTKQPEPDRLSIIDLESPDSSTYSPPPAAPYVPCPLHPNPDFTPAPSTLPSDLLDTPSPFSTRIIFQPPIPPNTPAWKIALSDRKGHRVADLHVSGVEIDILKQCMPLVQKAAEKAEVCVSTIMERGRLAREMEGGSQQWEEFCRDVERNVRMDTDATAGDPNGKRSSKKKEKGKGRDKGRDRDTRPPYSPSALLYDLANYADDDYFPPDPLADNGDEEEKEQDSTLTARHYGRLGPRDGEHAWGYRKVENASAAKDYSYADDDEGEHAWGYRKVEVENAVAVEYGYDDEETVDDEEAEGHGMDVDVDEEEEYDEHGMPVRRGGEEEEGDEEMEDAGSEGEMEGVEEEEEDTEDEDEDGEKGLKGRAGGNVGLYG